MKIKGNNNIFFFKDLFSKKGLMEGGIFKKQQNNSRRVFNSLLETNINFKNIEIDPYNFENKKTTNTLFIGFNMHSHKGKELDITNTLENKIRSISSNFDKPECLYIGKPSHSFYISIENKCDKIRVADYCKKTNNLNIRYTSDGLSFKYIYNSVMNYLYNKNILEKIDYSYEKNHEITIGIDTELELINSKGEILNTGKDENIGSSIMPNSVDPIGVDFRGGPVELRPTYGKSAIGLVKNLKELFYEIKNDKKVKHKMSIIGDKQALGSHIHFGLGTAYFPQKDLLSLLDYFIGKPLINLSGKRRLDYKRLSAFQVKPHGFEYRTLPSAIIRTPKMLKIVCKIGKKIVQEYSNGRTITINAKTMEGMAGSNDYIKLGIRDSEIKFFRNFIRQYKDITYKENAIAAWTKEKRV